LHWSEHLESKEINKDQVLLFESGSGPGGSVSAPP
jgi:hypothetical protein